MAAPAGPDFLHGLPPGSQRGAGPFGRHHRQSDHRETERRARQCRRIPHVRAARSTNGSRNLLDEKGVKIEARRETTSPWANVLYSWAPDPPDDRLLDLHHAADAERREQGPVVRQEPREVVLQLAEKSHVQGRLRRRRGQGRAPGNHRVPQGTAEVPEARRPHPQGRPADGLPGNRQDAARPRRRRRSQRPVLLDQRLGLRRDVRRRRRVARPRPLRAGQEERALHRLHRRDRRGRPPSRRRPRRRARRARADAQPAARRDGRLRVERRRHPRRRDQPSRRARPGAAPPRPLRPPHRRQSARREGPRGHPRRPHQEDPAVGRREHSRAGARHVGLLAAPISPTWSTKRR